MGDNIKKIGIRNDSGEYTYTDIGVDADKVDIDNTTLDQKISTIEEDITKKVDKVEGKGLSSNDFTDEHLSIVETMSTGIVTGIKGNAEDDYRTGDVNLTPENIGALPVDGNAASATKAEQDGNGKVISNTYATKSSILNTLEEIDANTSEGNIAGALALKKSIVKSTYVEAGAIPNEELDSDNAIGKFRFVVPISVDYSGINGKILSTSLIHIGTDSTGSNGELSKSLLLAGMGGDGNEKIIKNILVYSKDYQTVRAKILVEYVEN